MKTALLILGASLCLQAEPIPENVRAAIRAADEQRQSAIADTRKQIAAVRSNKSTGNLKDLQDRIRSLEKNDPPFVPQIGESLGVGSIGRLKLREGYTSRVIPNGQSPLTVDGKTPDRLVVVAIRGQTEMVARIEWETIGTNRQLPRKAVGLPLLIRGLRTDGYQVGGDGPANEIFEVTEITRIGGKQCPVLEPIDLMPHLVKKRVASR